MMHLTAGVAVESKVVDGAGGNTGDLVLEGKALDAGRESSGAAGTLEAQEVGTETSNVGSSHRGTGDGVGAAADPGGEDRDTRSENVNDGAVVGERGDAVRAVSGANGEDSGLRSGRRVGSVTAVVTSGNSHEDTSGDSVGGSRVDGSGAAATKRHVGNGTLGAATGLDIVGNKVDTSNHTRVGARAIGTKDLDSVELGLLGDSVGLGANGTSAVGAVTVAVGVAAIASVVGEESGTALELRVGGVDTSVDDVGAGTGTGSAVVGVGGTATALAGNTRETPGGTRLGDVGLLLERGLVELSQVGLDDGILLNVVDLYPVRV